MIVTATRMQSFGLELMRVRLNRKNKKHLEKLFHSHYGSSSATLANTWFDLCYYTGSWGTTVLSQKEKSQKGLKRFCAAQYWLWQRPKNANTMATTFDMCTDYCQGQGLWKWIEYLATLAEKKIVWDPRLDMKSTEYYAITGDGVDFKMWERKHKLYPYDTKAMSHKFRKCAAKYLIALSTYESKCVFIAGPFRGGKGDLDIFRESGLLKRLLDNGKVCIADRGYIPRLASEKKAFALPENMDNGKEIGKFKSRARCRQETFNARLKCFGCLQQTFTNGFLKHGIALRAVAVMVQYQMDNGSPLYNV